MVSSAKPEQDKNKGSDSTSTTPMSWKISQDVGESSFESSQLKDQFTSTDDYAPKVRKPYMITKQREKWTEDEHQKFIEALKLYGRAWKRIEEHVGTKTAVQIRSHAQKFFSKVVRESSSGEVICVKAVEIPPPLPKKKPVHPYPRKLNLSSQTIDPTSEKPVRSASMSPCLSGLEYKNQSPTSVLSAVDKFETNTPIRSVSPVSSATDVHYGGSIGSSSLNRSSSDQVNSSPTSEETAAKLLMMSEDNGLPREGSVDASSSGCLKLFGMTMIVTDSQTESMPTVNICKPETINATDGSAVERLSWNMAPAKYYPNGLDNSLDGPCSASTSSGHYSSFQKGSSGYAETPSPFWTYSGTPFTSIQVYTPIPIKPCMVSDNREAHHMDFRKEGSSSGSNTESICLDGDEDMKCGIDAQSLEISLGRAHGYLASRSIKTSKLKHKTSLKGFVPYQRCVADRGTHSSMMSKQIEQRIHLSL